VDRIHALDELAQNQGEGISTINLPGRRVRSCVRLSDARLSETVASYQRTTGGLENLRTRLYIHTLIVLTRPRMYVAGML